MAGGQSRHVLHDHRAELYGALFDAVPLSRSTLAAVLKVLHEANSCV